MRRAENTRYGKCLEAPSPALLDFLITLRESSEDPIMEFYVEFIARVFYVSLCERCQLKMARVRRNSSVRKRLILVASANCRLVSRTSEYCSNLGFSSLAHSAYRRVNATYFFMYVLYIRTGKDCTYVLTLLTVCIEL